MSSPTDVVRGVQEPRVRHVPRSVGNDAEDAGYLGASYGLRPFEWQETVLEGWLGTKADGHWAAARCGLAVPRQNGKNAVLEMRELYGMVMLGESFLHTAHEVKTARRAFLRLVSFFESPQYPELRRLVKSVRRTNGQEAIYLTRDGRDWGQVEFIARSKGSGRGFTVDCLVMDEAQELSEESLAALQPTISASPNPQTIMTGTPPSHAANGEVFTRLRDAGLAGARRHSWHEWSVAGDVDLDDRRVWPVANPSLGYLMHYDTIADERAAMDDETFGRERLGRWESAAQLEVIDRGVWRGLVDHRSEVEDPVAFAVDVSPMGATASISLAGRRSDGLFHVETVKNGRGLDWVVEDLVSLRERFGPCAVVLDRVGPAGALTLPLQERGLDLLLMSGPQVAQACGAFLAAVLGGQLRHLDQPLLSTAVGSARKRDLGDAWAWHRKDATADITPLVSVTLALWGFQHAAAAPKPRPRARAFAF